MSLGAEKNFRAFMLRLPAHAADSVDPGYFSRLIAKGILFRRTEKIVSGLRFGGQGKYCDLLDCQALTLDSPAPRP